MEIETLARAVSQELKRQGLMLATAESCTGGWVAQMITSVAGSSEWFLRVHAVIIRSNTLRYCALRMLIE